MSGISGDIAQALEDEVARLVAELKEILSLPAPERDAMETLLTDLRGICRITELNAAVPLVDELRLSLLAVAEENEVVLDSHPELSPILDKLPRLITLLPGGKPVPPFLFIPEIAQLRKWRGKPPMYEYQLLPGHPWPPAERFQGARVPEGETHTLIKRLQQLYQLGLLDVLRNRAPGKGFERIAVVTGKLSSTLTEGPEHHYWAAVSRVATALKEGDLALTPERSRLLSAVERQLKTLLAGNAKAAYPLGLWRAFAVLLALAGRGERDDELLQWFGAPDLAYTDADIQRFRDRLRGTEDQDFESHIAQLGEKVQGLQNLLEMTEGEEGFSANDANLFTQLSGQTADLCDDLGLRQAARRFRQHAEAVSGDDTGDWQQDVSLPREVAHSLLYLECLLLNLREHGDAGAEYLQRLDSKSVDQMVEDNLLEAGTHAAWLQCLDKLSLAKDWLDEIASDLAGQERVEDLYGLFTDIRGAAMVVGDTRVVDIAWRCRDFVSDTLFRDPDQVNTRLAAFADAVIGLEAHIENTLKGAANDLPLTIADEHLAQLEAQ